MAVLASKGMVKSFGDEEWLTKVGNWLHISWLKGSSI